MKGMKNFKFYWEENDKKDLHVKIYVPGFAKDEIRVKLTDNSIRVSAEKKHQKIEEGKGFYREESFSRAFNKFIALPHKIRPEEFEVVISNGEVVLKRKKKIIKEKVSA